MTNTEKIKLLFEERGAVITTADAREAGISKNALGLLVASNAAERVSYGVYAPPGTLIDKMFIIQRNMSKVIYSHETALFLHDLTDRDPIRYIVTIPTGYNSQRLKAENMKVYSIKKEFHRLGETLAPTIFGNNVVTYNPERTICDCIRSRNQMDPEIVTNALKRYVERRDRNLNLLMEYASKFNVSNILRTYMEVLL